MKRKILASFLAVTVLGIVGLNIGANIGVKKHNNAKLVDLVGSREALGDTKLTSNIEIIDDFYNAKTVFSKDGVLSSEVVSEPCMIKNLDKKLMRGFSLSTENEKFSVAMKSDKDKGITVRYKNKADNKYKEFLLNEDFMKDCKLSNLYVKDDVVYSVTNNFDEDKFTGSNIIKISLSSEKIVGKVDLKIEEPLEDKHRAESKPIVKDNKMYMPSTSIDLCVKLYIFDLDKETVECKKIEGKDYKNIEHGNDSLSIHDNYICYKVNDYKQSNMSILIYDISADKLREITMKDKSLEPLLDIRITDFRVKGDKLYLSGVSYHGNDVENPFAAVIDSSKNSLDYAGIVKQNISSFGTETVIQ